MSPDSWQSSISQCLQPWTQKNRQPRIALLGIGNTLRSDDAAGVWVARRLSESRFLPHPEWVLILDAGPAPENRTAELRTFSPDFVILVDAAEMGERPGVIRWIGMDEIDGISATTHTLPLSMLAKYLSLELGCEVKLLGVQPKTVEVGERISAEVDRSISEIVNGVTGLFMTAG
jgi:hydrogenase 3 maturation protease